jgi:hypothetical protein
MVDITKLHHVLNAMEQDELGQKDAGVAPMALLVAV